MKRIDLNVDLAEGFPFDRELMALASSLNVGMGVHAGSPELTSATVDEAMARGLRWGGHPGYPDRPGMGRRTWREAALDSGETQRSLMNQARGAANLGAAYLKPHGAFYNASAAPGEEAEWLAEILGATGLPLLGLPGTEHEALAHRAGVGFRSEGFADRGVLPDGRLIPRGALGALVEDPALAGRQAVALLGRVDSICVHGDAPGCVEVLRAVREAVESAGYEVGA